MKLTIRGRDFVWGARTYVMGIVNVTPDSFSGDGLGSDVRAAVEQAKRFAGEGADMIDIGGESTRPGSAPVTAEQEMARVLPVIEGCAQAVDLPISVDTSKAVVAQAALAAGANFVNDVWGLRADAAMATFCAAAGCPLVLMHNRRTRPDAAQITRLGGHYAGVVYHDLLSEISSELRESVAMATSAGVASDKIIIDPGLGFAKTAEHNLEIMRRLGELKALGHPILIGPSRKSTIGLVLGLPVEQRVEGTAALVALGIAAGADIVRVHDVRAMARVARMSDAVVRGWTIMKRAPALHHAYLGMGTNLGERAANISEAVRRMADLGTVAAVSSLHETEPWGITEQPKFLNAVCLLLTTRAPYDLLVALKHIEQAMGRTPTVRNGPRLIDIDILFYDDVILAMPGLTIPHARLHERSFVLRPLVEIAPDVVHPVLKRTVRELADGLPAT